MRVVRIPSTGGAEILRASELFDEPPSRSATRRYLGDRRNIFLLAYMGRQPVGFLRGTELRQIHTGRRQMFLYEIAVASRFRRRGVARSLIQRLLRYCRSKNFEEAFVFTSPSNRAAVGLYRSTGAKTETDGDRMYVYTMASVRPRGETA
ncbi:MAG: GNAT family N-acetyltransferase [Thermoplasmata archaeon]